MNRKRSKSGYLLIMVLAIVPLRAPAGQDADPAEVNALLKQTFTELAAAKAQNETLKSKLTVAEARLERLAAEKKDLEDNNARLRAVLRDLAQRGFPVYEVLGQTANVNPGNGGGAALAVAPEVEQRIEQLVKVLADAPTPRDGHAEDWDWSEASKSARDELTKLGEPAIEPLLGLAAGSANAVVKMRAAATVQAIQQTTQAAVGAKVLDVGDRNDLVSIGLGQKQGIGIGQVFLVLREQKYVGQVRVTRVWDDLCVAQSVDKLEDPRVGDSAMALVDLRKHPNANATNGTGTTGVANTPPPPAPSPAPESTSPTGKPPVSPAPPAPTPPAPPTNDNSVNPVVPGPPDAVK
ncbi:MAG TPA: hypothetical protein VL860_03695 [Planctomycetota bacterium]|nr:hypothetical protein [Planctomycetota bacterium]